MSGGCLSLHWQAWRDRGAVPWVVEVLREGYRIPFLRPPPLSMELIPMPSYAPTSIKGAALGEVTLPLIATGAVEFAPLPSPGFSSPRFSGLEDLGVMASSHRPVHAHSLRGHFPLSPGTHPVCSHVSPSGGLDGLRRSSGGVSSGSCASGISSLPVLCGSWSHLPIQCVVLRSVHGPAGLPSGYGSCIRSSFLGYPFASLPGRLARPGIVPGGPPPRSRGCLVPLSRVGDSGQPGVVPFLRLRWYIISGWSSMHGLLCLLHRQISSPGCGPPPTNSVLRSASCLLVAVASGVAVLFVTSGSRWPPADEFAPDLPSPLLGSVGSFGSGAVVSGLSSGPSLVASRGSLLPRCLSPAGVPSSSLLVRRFRRRLGASLG